MKKIIIIVVILVVSVFLVIYFIPNTSSFKKFIGLGCKTMNWNDSFCVDKLPDFPEKIGEFVLYEYNKKNWESECNNLNNETFCSKLIRVVYYNENTQKAIHFMPTYLTEGKKSSIIDYIHENLVDEEVGENVFRLLEPWELFWSTSAEFDYIMTQTYLYEPRDDDSRISKVQTAEIDQEVIQYLLNKYPPVKKK